MDQPQFDDEIDLKEYFLVIVKRWKIVLLIAILVAALAYFYTSMQKPVYEVSTTILMRGPSSSALSQYSGLAGMMGVNMGGASGNAGDILSLIKSRAVAAKVLDDLKLNNRIREWDDPRIPRQTLITKVGKLIKPTKTTGNITEIKVEANDPQLAADIANAFISALSYYWNELNFTEAQKKLKYISQEMPRVERELESVENKLKLSPRTDLGVAIGGRGGLQRDYDIYNSVYTMLRKEYESTKLETSKEIPPFSIIDPAEKPLYPIGPRPRLNTLIGLIMGLCLGVFAAFMQEYIGKIR